VNTIQIEATAAGSITPACREVSAQSVDVTYTENRPFQVCRWVGWRCLTALIKLRRTGRRTSWSTRGIVLGRSASDRTISGARAKRSGTHGLACGSTGGKRRRDEGAATLQITLARLGVRHSRSIHASTYGEVDVKILKTFGQSGGS
jgi:hypothetical protein